MKFHIFVNQLVFYQRAGEAPELGVRGKLSVNDQERGLDEARSLGQLLNRDTAIAKDFSPSNEGDGALNRSGTPFLVSRNTVCHESNQLHHPLTHGTEGFSNALTDFPEPNVLT